MTDTEGPLGMADGSIVADRRLGRLKQFDQRSRMFRAVAGIENKPFRSYTWRVGRLYTAPIVLDQGSEGACVGFAWAHELAARPVCARDVNYNLGRSIYRDAQALDEWDDEDAEGTSVLAGAKAVKAMGRITGYSWAFGLDDLRRAIGYKGPAVLGLNWYDGMFEPANDGRIRPVGPLLGGHAILANGVDEKRQRVWLWNSWGPAWGRPYYGSCYLTFDDLGLLLYEQGEACIPSGRK